MPSPVQRPNNRVQHDAAGAASDLGASLAAFPCHHLPRSSDAASGAADAERSAAHPDAEHKTRDG